MSRKIVIDNITKKVKRHGFCDFENDGIYDSETESIIEKDFDFDDKYFYTYDDQSDDFTKGNLRNPETSNDYIEIYNHININTFQFINRYEVPKDLDYDILGLYKKITIP